MNWVRIYKRVPERIRIGVCGIGCSMLFVSAPTLMSAWLRFWA